MLTDNLIQIAGIIDEAEADMLVGCGVRYLGFPLRLPVHSEDLTEDSAARIIARLAPPCYGVLITYLDDARAIHDFAHQLGARIVQLHGDVAPRQLKALKLMDSGLVVIKSLVVGMHAQAKLEEDVERLAPYVDAFLIDTFDPTTGASGATGRTHDWSTSRALVEISTRPVILAGGLTPENVRRA
ncbi:MAG: phosphoribosylanthranilate isomerase, partial [Gemmatimonadales bacterium]|nr:phosphoribosylanthranilate isomerase [Gemmatimonadales bacterium]